MDQQNLNILKEKINIAPEHILREFYEMIILQAFSETNLTKNMVFYGGTSLRLAYNGPRFSEDLDFLMIKPVSARILKKVLTEVCQKYPALSLVEVKIKRNTLFSLIKIQHSALKHSRHIKIEICKRKNGVKREYRLLHSECSNFSPLIQTITLPSLEKLKIAAIKERKEARDWADLWFIANFLKKPFEPPSRFPFDPKEFKRELKRFITRDKWVIIDEILKTVKNTRP